MNLRKIKKMRRKLTKRYTKGVIKSIKFQMKRYPFLDHWIHICPTAFITPDKIIRHFEKRGFCVKVSKDDPIRIGWEFEVSTEKTTNN